MEQVTGCFHGVIQLNSGALLDFRQLNLSCIFDVDWLVELSHVCSSIVWFWLPMSRNGYHVVVMMQKCLIRVTHIVLICSLFFFLLSLPFCILGRNFPTTFRYCDKIVSSNHPLKPQGRGGKNTTTTKNTFFLLRARQSCVNVSWPHCSTVC